MSIASSERRITADAARYVAEFEPAQLARATIERAQHAVLDLLGIAVRAKLDADSSPAVARAVAELAKPGPCRAIGHAERYAPHCAALVNGIYAHTLDFDDTHEAGSIHPGAPVIPAALAIAEERRASGLALIAAIVVGYDVTVRLSEAMGPAAQYARGFHPTAVCGTFGAAAAAARLCGDDADRVEQSFGLANSFAAGAMAFLNTGGWNKRVHVGYAAHNGIVARTFAAAGVEGARDAFEDRFGAFANYSGRADATALHDLAQRPHAIEETATKPYPSCRYSHAALDALLDLVREREIVADEVERVEVRVPSVAMGLIGDDPERRRRARTIVAGQFSMHFLAAAAILRRRFDWSDYDLLGDPEVERLAERIDVVADPELDAAPVRMRAVVALRARGGRTWTRRSEVPRGEPETALGWDELVAKFDDLAGVAYDAPRRAAIVERVHRLAELPDVRALTDLLGA